MAPEVIKMSDDNPYTFQSDVYAFGKFKFIFDIILFNFLTMKFIYILYLDITFIFDISYESSVVISLVCDNLSTAIGKIDGIGTCKNKNHDS